MELVHYVIKQDWPAKNVFSFHSFHISDLIRIFQTCFYQMTDVRDSNTLGYNTVLYDMFITYIDYVQENSRLKLFIFNITFTADSLRTIV